MKRPFPWRKTSHVGPTPSPEEMHRADQWLRGAFTRDAERIEEQAPGDLLDRCVKAAREAEARPNARPWLSYPAWGWAALAVLVALAAALIVRTARHDSAASSNRAGNPAQPAPTPAPVVVRPAHSPTGPPSRGGSSSPERLAQGESPPQISRRPHTTESIRRKGAVTQRDPARGIPGSRSLAPGEETGEMPVTQVDQRGDVVAEWELQSPNPQDAARGSVQFVAGGAASGPTASVAVEASNLTPDATYEIVVQFAEYAEPVVLERGKTDSRGALRVSAEWTPQRVEAIRAELAAIGARTGALLGGSATASNQVASAGSTASSRGIGMGTLNLPDVTGVTVTTDTGETALQPAFR